MSQRRVAERGSSFCRCGCAELIRSWVVQHELNPFLWRLCFQAFNGFPLPHILVFLHLLFVPACLCVTAWGGALYPLPVMCQRAALSSTAETGNNMERQKGLLRQTCSLSLFGPSSAKFWTPSFFLCVYIQTCWTRSTNSLFCFKIQNLLSKSWQTAINGIKHGFYLFVFLF